ncbi:m(7)G2069 methylase of 23S rRNA (Ribosomal RNA large subunit methyltransferase) [Oenococcus oeni]|uniref:THUMP domain-containing class I SAM-dependent RNA methyltransferase n=1 Tax=Oenococcus oeni TaxID=1247 RepID=UPI0010B7E92B|nr:class I SAM-dependent RNA methyltransferase [Oenococcus oeni]SYW04623.1 m(7)G2069 methylase of 23S rRNA (Ribosomal RNA large subunit methyltransferase) [Oenococcus oeni]
MKQFNLIATSGQGIEALVAKELNNLGYQTRTENGFVRFSGNQRDILKTNIWLRTADRIKILVGEFHTLRFDDLFESVKAFPWSELISWDDQFPVMEAHSRDSQLFSVPDIQRITKKAIVEALRSQTGHEDLPETGKHVGIDIRIDKNNVRIMIDTSGESLFKRGYRTEHGGAPLKENFAAALVLLTNWFTDNPFVDPVCGSGTIPIEAALIGKNIAPGINRTFEIESWAWFDKKLSQDVREEADSLAKYDQPLDISGYDIDGNMIRISKENAKKAGLYNDIAFKQLAVKDWQTDKINGILVANPPYGQRLGEIEDARQIYQQMGSIYNQMPTWSKYILTSDEKFEQFYGKKATKKRKLYNGPIRTDLYQYWGKKVR